MPSHPWKSNEYFHNCAHVNFSFISLWFSSATHYPNAFHKFLTINTCLNQLRKKLMKMFWVFFHLTTLLMLVFLFYLQVGYVEMGWSNCVCVVFLFLNLIYYNHGQKFWEWHTYWFSKFAASLFLEFKKKKKNFLSCFCDVNQYNYKHFISFTGFYW